MWISLVRRVLPLCAALLAVVVFPASAAAEAANVGPANDEVLLTGSVPSNDATYAFSEDAAFATFRVTARPAIEGLIQLRFSREPLVDVAGKFVTSFAPRIPKEYAPAGSTARIWSETSAGQYQTRVPLEIDLSSGRFYWQAGYTIASQSCNEFFDCTDTSTIYYSAPTPVTVIEGPDGYAVERSIPVQADADEYTEHIELLSGGEDGGAEIYLWDRLPDGRSSRHLPITPTAKVGGLDLMYASIVLFRDLNGDGRKDLYWRGGYGGTVSSPVIAGITSFGPGGMKPIWRYSVPRQYRPFFVSGASTALRETVRRFKGPEIVVTEPLVRPSDCNGCPFKIRVTTWAWKQNAYRVITRAFRPVFRHPQD